MTRTYQYTVYGDLERFELDSKFVPASYWLFEDAAEDFYHNDDGWECEWPIRFDLYDNDRWLGAKVVHMEMVPSFTGFDIVEQS